MVENLRQTERFSPAASSPPKQQTDVSKRAHERFNSIVYSVEL